MPINDVSGGSPSKTRVYVDVVCDLFHVGHVRFLERARALGDTLIVGVNTDDLVITYKRRPVLTLAERCEVVAACRFVDEVIPGAASPVTESFIAEHEIDWVVHGDDMDTSALEYWYSDPIRLGILRTVPYYPKLSTSMIIDRIRRRVHDDDI